MSQIFPKGLAALLLGAVFLSSFAALAQGGDEDLFDDIGTPPEPAPPEPTPPPDLSESDEIEEIDAAPAGVPRRVEPKVKPKKLESPGAQDRVKAVPRKSVLKKGRVELAAFTGLSVNDAYFQHLTGNASVIYYLHDSFGIGIGADYLYAHLRSENVTVVRQSMISVPAPLVFGFPRLLAHVDSYWVPVYGKVSLFGASIIHFELYATAGLGVAFRGKGRTVPAVNAGVGQRFFLGDWLGLRFELRDHLFLDTQDVSGQLRSDIQSYVLFYAGASFFLPPSFEYSYR
ncbi:MAG: outer membrane beta-barrel domain-containing protein [Myxococcota bacterium]